MDFRITYFRNMKGYLWICFLLMHVFPYGVKSETNLEQISDGKIDLVIILDSSTSIGKQNFIKMKNFCKDFLKKFDLDSGDIRVGMMSYNTDIHIWFQLNDYNTSKEVVEAIDAISYSYGNAYTADALKKMSQEMFTVRNGDRDSVKDFVIIIIDGGSTNRVQRTITEAEKAHEKGIEIYGVGIGLNGRDALELFAIVSKPPSKYSFRLQHFDELDAVSDKLFKSFDQGQVSRNSSGENVISTERTQIVTLVGNLTTNLAKNLQKLPITTESYVHISNQQEISVISESMLSVSSDPQKASVTTESELPVSRDPQGSSVATDSKLLVSRDPPGASVTTESQLSVSRDQARASMATESQLSGSKDLQQASVPTESQLSVSRDLPGPSLTTESQLSGSSDPKVASVITGSQLSVSSYQSRASLFTESQLTGSSDPQKASVITQSQISQSSNPLNASVINDSQLSITSDRHVTLSITEPQFNSKSHTTATTELLSDEITLPDDISKISHETTTKTGDLLKRSMADRASSITSSDANLSKTAEYKVLTTVSSSFLGETLQDSIATENEINKSTIQQSSESPLGMDPTSRIMQFSQQTTMTLVDHMSEFTDETTDARLSEVLQNATVSSPKMSGDVTAVLTRETTTSNIVRETLDTVTDGQTMSVTVRGTTSGRPMERFDTVKETTSYNSSKINLNITTEEMKLKGIWLKVMLHLKKGTECRKISTSYTESDGDSDSEITKKTSCSGRTDDQTVKVRGLNAGTCYNFSIDIATNSIDLGPYNHLSCTTPKRPGIDSTIMYRTSTSLMLSIQNPDEGRFDSFAVEFAIGINGVNKTSVVNSRDGDTTLAELNGMDPGGCYTIRIYTVSNTIKSANPRELTDECLLPAIPGRRYDVLNGESWFRITWQKPVGFFDNFTVNVFCQSLTNHTYIVQSNFANVAGIMPGDCCRITVTTCRKQYYSLSQQYFVYINDSVPNAVVIHKNQTSKTKLLISWSPPVKHSGWILRYKVQLYDNRYSKLKMYDLECNQTEGKCSKKFFPQKSQCTDYYLLNDSDGVKFTMRDSILELTMTNLQPGTVYFYTIDSVNKAGPTIGPHIQVETVPDIPGPPADVNVTVLNTNSMSVTWMLPVKPNGKIIGYRIQYIHKYSIGMRPAEKTVTGNTTSVLLTGLDCWKSYNVCVSAKSTVGFGGERCSVGTTNVYEPMSELKSISQTSSSIHLVFKTPCDSSNVPVWYNISYVTQSHTCDMQGSSNVLRWMNCTFGSPCELIGLYSYWNYSLRVQEITTNKSGPWSKEYRVKTNSSDPEAVRNLIVTKFTSDSITICWQPPCFTNGPFKGYRISLKGQRFDLIQDKCNTIKNLKPYKVYQISVVTENENSKQSKEMTIVQRTDTTKPSKPTVVKSMVGKNMIRVTWSPPELYPGPVNYSVQVKDMEDGSMKYCNTSSVNITSCIVNGLEEFWDYMIIVIAQTDKGINMSSPYRKKTQQAAPGPVSNFSVETESDPEKPRQVHVKFMAPERRNRNGVLKAYYVKCVSVKSKQTVNVLRNQVEDISELKILSIAVPEQVLLNISVFAETIENGTEVYKTVIVPKGADVFPILPVIAGILSAVFLFVIIAFVILIFRKKGLFCFKSSSKSVSIDMKEVKQARKKISVENEDKRKSRPVKIDRFYQHVEIMARDCNHFFSKEYKELRGMAPSFSTEAAEQQEARAKNRYSNILPFDHSRVKLLPLDDDEGSDFINANYIPGFNSKREYIATQGPLPSTKDDFWRMVWEQNASVVVMLTQCVERGKRKCECYWPECVKEPVYYGDLCIEIENESHLPEYVLRTINLTLGNVQKSIKHFLYLAWPDMGVPSSTDNMISFVKTVRTHVSMPLKGPLTIHCSAGVGRTGTFIAVDILLHQLDADYSQIDIFGDVLKLRNHRCNMVQTEDQYIFIHHCISDYILAMTEDSDEEEAATDGGEEPMYQNVPRR